MTNAPVSRTITFSDRTPAALAWVLREEIETSKERLPDLSFSDAVSEVADLDALKELLASIDGEATELTVIQAEISKMKEHIEARRTARYAEIHAQVHADYEALKGNIVLLTEIECYDERSSSATAVCDPPAVGRILPYSPARARDCLERWADSTHCDPVYDVEILEPHPAFAGLRPSWVFGTSYSFDGASAEKAKIELADDEMQRRYAGAKGLSDEEVAPSSAPAP